MLNYADDLQSYDNVTRQAVNLTERERALLASVLFYFEDSGAWEDYDTNSEEIDNLIAETIYRLSE